MNNLNKAQWLQKNYSVLKQSDQMKCDFPKVQLIDPAPYFRRSLFDRVRHTKHVYICVDKSID